MSVMIEDIIKEILRVINRESLTLWKSGNQFKLAFESLALTHLVVAGRLFDS